MKVARYDRRLRDPHPAFIVAIYRRAWERLFASLADIPMMIYGIGPAARPGKFKVGDLVTRAGDDLQRVIDVDEEGFCMTVVCIRAPAAGWCAIGEEERNLCRRYEHALEELPA